MPDSPGDSFVQILHAARAGDSKAWETLYASLLVDLRKLAANRRKNEPDSLTLATMDIVQEAYLRVPPSTALACHDRKHLINLYVRTMRRLLIDHARAKHSVKRGGSDAVPDSPGNYRFKPTIASLQNDAVAAAIPPSTPADLDARIDLEAALEWLDQQDQQAATLFALHHVHHYDLQSIAQMLEIPNVGYVKRQLAWARSLLQSRLAPPGAP